MGANIVLYALRIIHGWCRDYLKHPTDDVKTTSGKPVSGSNKKSLPIGYGQQGRRDRSRENLLEGAIVGEHRQQHLGIVGTSMPNSEGSRSHNSVSLD